MPCALGGTGTCTHKSGNYEKVKEVTHKRERENPAFFQGQHVEAFRKSTDIDPPTPDGQTLLEHAVSPCWNMLSALTLGGNSRSYKSARRPQCCQLLEVALGVFSNPDQTEDEEPDVKTGQGSN